MADEQRVNNAVRLIAQLSIDKASQAFSKTIKTGARIEMVNATMEDISEATARAYQESKEVVGAFITLAGDVTLKFLFYVSVPDSFVLTDLMLRKELGTTTKITVYTMSAVQEIGNILASAVSNVFAADLQVALKPSPPTVVHDYAGTLFEEYLLDVAAEQNEIMMIESLFCVVRTNVRCAMFLLPSAGSASMLNVIMKSA